MKNSEDFFDGTVYDQFNNILASEHCITIPVKWDISSLIGTISDPSIAKNGYRIVPAGTIYPSNDANAKGILINDAFVNNKGIVEGTIVLHAFVDCKKMPVQPSRAAIKALSDILFKNIKHTTAELIFEPITIRNAKEFEEEITGNIQQGTDPIAFVAVPTENDFTFENRDCFVNFTVESITRVSDEQIIIKIKSDGSNQLGPSYKNLTIIPKESAFTTTTECSGSVAIKIEGNVPSFKENYRWINIDKPGFSDSLSFDLTIVDDKYASLDSNVEISRNNLNFQFFHYGSGAIRTLDLVISEPKLNSKLDPVKTEETVTVYPAGIFDKKTVAPNVFIKYGKLTYPVIKEVELTLLNEDINLNLSYADKFIDSLTISDFTILNTDPNLKVSLKSFDKTNATINISGTASVRQTVNITVKSSAVISGLSYDGADVLQVGSKGLGKWAITKSAFLGFSQGAQTVIGTIVGTLTDTKFSTKPVVSDFIFKRNGIVTSIAIDKISLNEDKTEVTLTVSAVDHDFWTCLPSVMPTIALYPKNNVLELELDPEIEKNFENDAVKFGILMGNGEYNTKYLEEDCFNITVYDPESTTFEPSAVIIELVNDTFKDVVSSNFEIILDGTVFTSLGDFSIKKLSDTKVQVDLESKFATAPTETVYISIRVKSDAVTSGAQYQTLELHKIVPSTYVALLPFPDQYLNTLNYAIGNGSAGTFSFKLRAVNCTFNTTVTSVDEISLFQSGDKTSLTTKYPVMIKDEMKVTYEDKKVATFTLTVYSGDIGGYLGMPYLITPSSSFNPFMTNTSLFPDTGRTVLAKQVGFKSGGDNTGSGYKSIIWDYSLDFDGAEEDLPLNYQVMNNKFLKETITYNDFKDETGLGEHLTGDWKTEISNIDYGQKVSLTFLGRFKTGVAKGTNFYAFLRDYECLLHNIENGISTDMVQVRGKNPRIDCGTILHKDIFNYNITKSDLTVIEGGKLTSYFGSVPEKTIVTVPKNSGITITEKTTEYELDGTGVVRLKLGFDPNTLDLETDNKFRLKILDSFGDTSPIIDYKDGYSGCTNVLPIVKAYYLTQPNGERLPVKDPVKYSFDFILKGKDEKFYDEVVNEVKITEIKGYLINKELKIEKISDKQMRLTLTADACLPEEYNTDMTVEATICYPAWTIDEDKYFTLFNTGRVPGEIYLTDPSPLEMFVEKSSISKYVEILNEESTSVSFVESAITTDNITIENFTNVFTANPIFSVGISDGKVEVKFQYGPSYSAKWQDDPKDLFLDLSFTAACFNDNKERSCRIELRGLKATSDPITFVAGEKDVRGEIILELFNDEFLDSFDENCYQITGIGSLDNPTTSVSVIDKKNLEILIKADEVISDTQEIYFTLLAKGVKFNRDYTKKIIAYCVGKNKYVSYTDPFELDEGLTTSISKEIEFSFTEAGLVDGSERAFSPTDFVIVNWNKFINPLITVKCEGKNSCIINLTAEGTNELTESVDIQFGFTNAVKFEKNNHPEGLLKIGRIKHLQATRIVAPTTLPVLLIDGPSVLGETAIPKFNIEIDAYGGTFDTTKAADTSKYSLECDYITGGTFKVESVSSTTVKLSVTGAVFNEAGFTVVKNPKITCDASCLIPDAGLPAITTVEPIECNELYMGYSDLTSVTASDFPISKNTTIMLVNDFGSTVKESGLQISFENGTLKDFAVSSFSTSEVPGMGYEIAFHYTAASVIFTDETKPLYFYVTIPTSCSAKGLDYGKLKVLKATEK